MRGTLPPQSRCFFQCCESVPHHFHGLISVKRKGAREDPAEGPTASLENPLSNCISFITLGAVPAIAIALDRDSRHNAFHYQINPISRNLVLGQHSEAASN